MKQVTRLVVFLVLFGAGVATGYSLRYMTMPQHTIEEESVILLEKIKTVAKLVTVEGYFVEIYNGSDKYGLPLPAFRKSAVIQVTGKALFGIDLSEVEFTPIPDEKVIEITRLPEGKLLALETDIDFNSYFEGVLNLIKKEDLTKWTVEAKRKLKDTIEQNEELKRRATAQGYEVMKIIEKIAEDAGWTVRYVEHSARLAPVNEVGIEKDSSRGEEVAQ